MAGEVIRKKGPKAVIECKQDIPCNPCTTCCAFKAITFAGSISSLPELDEEKCIGCGICVARCPGMAIFVVDEDYSETEGLVSFAHEFLPMPVVGQQIQATDRQGKVVCNGTVHKVMQSDAFDCTAVVTICIPKEHLQEVRGMKRLERGA